MTLSTHIRKYFWDVNADNASPQKHSKYYMTRILELGDWQVVKWLFDLFGKNKVKNLLPTLRLSNRSANYWHYYFSNLSEN